MSFYREVQMTVMLDSDPKELERAGPKRGDRDVTTELAAAVAASDGTPVFWKTVSVIIEGSGAY
jgi:hypothetical protein